MRRAELLLLLIAACGGHRDPEPAPPPPRPHGKTRLVITAHDGDKPVGARVLLFTAKDRVPLRFGQLDLYDTRQSLTACAIAPGVLATWDGFVLAYGSAEIATGTHDCQIPPGRYHAWVWRGVEYERFEADVDLRPDRGDVVLDAPLERAWTPHGALSADLHVHAHLSEDSQVPNPQRVIAQVAAGIEVIGLSDHNASGDLDDEIHDLHLDTTVASIASNELTSDYLHVGVYPVPRGSGPLASELETADPERMLMLAHLFPGKPVVEVNHPRFRYAALFDTAQWDGVAWPPPFPLAFDAFEVLAGYTAFNAPGDRRIDESVRDYYTFIDHGHLVSAMGNSDAHNLNWVHDGLTRNYVFVDDARVGRFDEAGFVAAIRGRRMLATSGPWLDVEVAPARGGKTVGPGGTVVPVDGKIWVDVTVSQARFSRADQLRIRVGGREAIAVSIPSGRDFHWAGAVEVGRTDTWLGIDCGGDVPLPPEQTGNYQQEKWKHPGVTPFAIIGPLLVDADGDHRWKRGDADLPLR